MPSGNSCVAGTPIQARHLFENQKSREVDDDNAVVVFETLRSFKLSIEGRKFSVKVNIIKRARREKVRKRRRLLCSKKTVFITMAAPEVRLCLKVN